MAQSKKGHYGHLDSVLWLMNPKKEANATATCPNRDPPTFIAGGLVRRTLGGDAAKFSTTKRRNFSTSNENEFSPPEFHSKIN